MKILCIDSLDARRVEEFSCKNLMLEHHGTVEVPINKDSGQASTPEVWRAFLTGKHTPTGFKGDHWLIKTIRPVRMKLPVSIRNSLKLGLGKRIIKATRHLNRFPERDFKTFFDVLPELKEINMPYYGFTPEDHYQRTLDLIAFSENRLSKREFLGILDAEIKDVSGRARSASGDWCAYFFALDTLQHCSWLDRSLIERYYRRFDVIAGRLKPDLVVSDHGSEAGQHWPRGFWASRRVLCPVPEKIEDFYGLVVGDEL